MKQALHLILLLLISLAVKAQPTPAKDSLLQKDTIVIRKDSVRKDTGNLYQQLIDRSLSQHRYIHLNQPATALQAIKRRPAAPDLVYYCLFGIVSLLAVLRFVYTRYFDNLFRVFFNTSLRQSQLTDQLLQAKLPSLLFNLLFVLSGGFFLYFLLRQFQLFNGATAWEPMLLTVGGVTAVYLVKFITLRFTGWITGFRAVTNTYIFIIFLINKILGILLLPLTIMMAFSLPTLAMIAASVGILMVLLLLLLRFFRSYGILQQQLSISRWHFLLYLAGIEILPLLLIYKGLLILLGKSS